MSQKTTQHAIVAIFKQFEQYNRLHDTSKPLFFDTETTGGGRKDPIIEIAFCDSDRNLIINTLIYTNKPFSAHDRNTKLNLANAYQIKNEAID